MKSGKWGATTGVCSNCGKRFKGDAIQGRSGKITTRSDLCYQCHQEAKEEFEANGEGYEHYTREEMGEDLTDGMQKLKEAIRNGDITAEEGDEWKNEVLLPFWHKIHPSLKFHLNDRVVDDAGNSGVITQIRQHDYKGQPYYEFFLSRGPYSSGVWRHSSELSEVRKKGE